jgi:ABC-type transport system involved in multi-copper enzyme maturation permease subunit
MTLLPIVERELRVASRRRGPFVSRVLTAALGMGVFGWLMVLVFPGVGTPEAEQGPLIFRGLLVVAALYGTLGALAITSDSLSQEKREGTLGLLFLTDLRGWDVVWGKLVAATVSSLYALMAIVPVLALSVQLGGVTFGELGMAVLAIGNVTFCSLVVGLGVSVLSRVERKALTASMMVMFFLVVTPGVVGGLLAGFLNYYRQPAGWAFWVAGLSPAMPVGYLIAWMWRGPGMGVAMGMSLEPFWISLGLTHLWAWVMLWAACWALPRAWKARDSVTAWARWLEHWEQWVYGRGAERQRLRRRLLEVNPFLWILQRERGKAWYAWLYFGVVLTVWLMGNLRYDEVLIEVKSAVPGLMLIQAFLKVWVVSECATRLSEDRRMGAMELILTTPLEERGIIRGHWLALRRQFLLSVVVFGLFEFWVLGRALGWEMAGVAVGVLGLDLMALAWVGMWLGMSARGPNRAVVRTLGLVLLLPWGLWAAWMSVAPLFHRWAGYPVELGFTYGFWVWCVAGVLVDVGVGLIWARRRLLRDFRRIASEGVEGVEARRGWANRGSQAA